MAAAPPTAPQPARPPAAGRSAPEIPRFAHLDVDPDRAFPLRAKIRFSGSRYLRHDASAVATKRTSMLATETVLDADATGSPRRPRLLCDASDARVAAYVDAQDFGTVALAGTVIEPVPMTAKPDDPGVHLVAGALLDATVTGEVVHVRFKDLFLSADGVVPRDHVDIVFAPEPPVTPPTANGVLERNVDVLASPGGPVVARIAKDPEIDNILTVELLGTAGAFTKIRYDEDEAYVIGWVPRNAVRARTLGEAEGIGTIGTGGGAPTRTVTLDRGTLLSDGETGAIVGVVIASGTFACTADCAGPEPTIRIEACGGNVDVRAHAPR